MGALLGEKNWGDLLRELRDLNNPAVLIVLIGYDYNSGNDLIRHEYVILLGKLWQALIRDNKETP